jgi:lipoate-protein ligase B
MAEVTHRSPTSTYFHYRRRMMSSLAHPNPDEAHENASSPAMEVFSALDHGCIDYSKSWAWQHTLLSRRLALRRTMNSSSETPVEMNDPDCVLLLEHAPVYTLGRGSDESHLTFLSSSDDTAIQERLSRKARGPGTARLTVDRQVDEVVGNLPLPQAIDHLSKLATPVLAPNGVPIYRVERGGEVTWHGPSQLVVYPLFDLRRSPFQQDLHWYSRMVEEVVIQTLQHYNIEGYRDDEHTGEQHQHLELS